MKHYSLPLDIQSMKDINSDTDRIDMSDIHFKGDSKKQKRSAFLFIRNTNLSAQLDFSNCSYEDKEEYLMLFMSENIEVRCDILASTWMEILMRNHSDDVSIILPCMLTHDEIGQFIKTNKDFIGEVMNLIYSLPVYAIQVYWYMSKDNTGAFDTSKFPKSDYNGICAGNFCQLIKFDDFMMIITPPEDFVPTYYSKYFNLRDNLTMATILEDLPYLNLINIMVGPKEGHVKFADGIREMLTVGGEDN